MSFRGFQKGMVRAPQQIKSRFNIGEHTKDAVYTDAERRFQELEKETKNLHDESKKYFEAINNMLNHQIEFSKAMTEIYKPISGRVSDPETLRIEGNPDGIRACEEYEAVVKDLQETLQPELELIESRVIQPANELLDVIKVIRKTAVKRDHKKLDYDRHRATLKKLQEKKERSAKDEKAMWKAENEVEKATQEYEYYNDLLKDELPKLFALEAQFIQPLFQSFYYMQLNIFYTLHEKMQQCDIGYFDLTLEIEEAFYRKRGDIQEQAEALSITRFKTTGRPRPPKFGTKPAIEAASPRPAIEAPPLSSSSSPSITSTIMKPPIVSNTRPVTAISAGPSSIASPFGSSKASIVAAAATPYQQQPSPVLDNPPPPYSPSQAGAGAANLAAIAAAKSKPPPPRPKPKHLGGAGKLVETVTALHNYEAQAEGDLSFRAGDVIEVVTRTQNTNEWWTGKLHGREGQFPGNYVQLNS